MPDAFKRGEPAFGDLSDLLMISNDDFERHEGDLGKGVRSRLLGHRDDTVAVAGLSARPFTGAGTFILRVVDAAVEHTA